MDADYIHDLFSSFGLISIKKMFGGKGIYAEGLIIAIEMSKGEIVLKADSISAPEFIAAGCTQWTYEGKSKPVAMPYWTVPESALDDLDQMAIWANKALAASKRAAAGSKKRDV